MILTMPGYGSTPYRATTQNFQPLPLRSGFFLNPFKSALTHSHETQTEKNPGSGSKAKNQPGVRTKTLPGNGITLVFKRKLLQISEEPDKPRPTRKPVKINPDIQKPKKIRSISITHWLKHYSLRQSR
jgi:hypothetical protein